MRLSASLPKAWVRSGSASYGAPGRVSRGVDTGNSLNLVLGLGVSSAQSAINRSSSLLEFLVVQGGMAV